VSKRKYTHVEGTSFALTLIPKRATNRKEDVQHLFCHRLTTTAPVTILDAKAKLETEGLHVCCNNAHSLWIAASVRDMGAGIKFSDDACSLIWNSSRWVAVFPAKGLLTYEIPGSLPELVSVITAVYASYRRTGSPLKDVFKQVVPDAEHYLVGRSPLPV